MEFLCQLKGYPVLNQSLKILGGRDRILVNIC